MNPYRDTTTPLDDPADLATIEALRPWRPPFALAVVALALPTTLLFVFHFGVAHGVSMPALLSAPIALGIGWLKARALFRKLDGRERPRS
jgi:hypothetical protein